MIAGVEMYAKVDAKTKINVRIPDIHVKFNKMLYDYLRGLPKLMTSTDEEL